MLEPDQELPLMMWDKPPAPRYWSPLMMVPVPRLTLSLPAGQVRIAYRRLMPGEELWSPTTRALSDRLLLVEMVEELAPVQ